MPYERTRQIEQRFEQVIRLIQQNSPNAKKLAEAFSVSPATIHRIIAELRNRGHVIRSVRDTQGWRYELVSTPQSGDSGDET